MENSLVLQWLGLCAFTAKDPGSIPSWETKISQPAQCDKKKFFFFFITQIERAKDKSVLKKKKKSRENYQSVQDDTDPILPASLHQV